MTGSRFGTATSPPLLTTLDLEEEILADQATANSLAVVRRGAAPGVGNIWFLSGAGFKQPSTDQGYLWRNLSSVGVQLVAMTTLAFDHPMGADVSTDPPGFTRPVRYTCQCVMRRTSLPAMNPATFICSAIATALGFTTEEGFEVSSQLEVNAGNWAVRRRNVAAGAIVTVDTGIAGLTDVFAEIIYEHTSAPVLFARVNGAEFGRVTGLANIPQRPTRVGNQTGWHIGNTHGSGAAAAGQDLFRGFRIIIEELPGFV